MREITKLIIHCSDSDAAAHDRIEVIQNWHIERGFKKIGYHFVITKNGEVKIGREEEEVGAHCKGENEDSIGICLTGRTVFTSKQFKALNKLVLSLLTKYKLSIKDVYPHNHFNSNKTCPNFKIDMIWSAGD